MNLNPGSDVFIYGVCYDPATNELEVYPRDRDGWWGITMTQAQADQTIAKVNRHGVFFHNHVRHIQIGPTAPGSASTHDA